MGFQSMQSSSFDDHYVRHQQFFGELTPVTSYLDRRDATFWIHDGLAGQGVSFRSLNFQNMYLRHQDFRIRLSSVPIFGSDEVLNRDATFLPVAGLAGVGTSYKAFSIQGDYYLRHRDFHLWVDQNDGSETFTKDATFHVVDPLAPEPTSDMNVTHDATKGYVEINGHNWTEGAKIYVSYFNVPHRDHPVPGTPPYVEVVPGGSFYFYDDNIRCDQALDPNDPFTEVHVWCVEHPSGYFVINTAQAVNAWICPPVQ
jgi:Alpha-L-arabinofuranosidase B (ABFB) domain